MAVNCLGYSVGLIFFLFRWKRGIVLKNLNLSKIELNLLKLYLNTGKDLVCFLFYPATKNFRVYPPHEQKFFDFLNSGGILLTSHFHNWELMGSFLSSHQKIQSFASPLKNPLINKWILFLRSKRGYPVIQKNFKLKFYGSVTSNEVIALHLDQYNPKSSLQSFLFNFPFRPTFNLGNFLGSSPTSVWFFYLHPDKTIRIHKLYSPPLFLNHKVKQIDFEEKYQLQVAKRIIGEKVSSRYFKFLQILIIKYPDYYYGFFHRIFKQTVSYPCSTWNTFKKFIR